MTEKRAASRTDAQQAAEAAAIQGLSSRLGLPLASAPLNIGGQQFNVDGYYSSDELIILAEVWAHIGRAKSAHRHKVMSDILKLALLNKLLIEECPGANVKSYIVFIDAEAANVLLNASWGALAATKFGIKPIIVDIAQEHLAAVAAAQCKQDIRTEA